MTLTLTLNHLALCHGIYPDSADPLSESLWKTLTLNVTLTLTPKHRP